MCAPGVLAEAFREGSSHRRTTAILHLTGSALPFLFSRMCVLSAVREFSRQGSRFGGALLLTKAVLATYLPADGRCALSLSQQSCQSFRQAVPNLLIEY